MTDKPKIKRSSVSLASLPPCYSRYKAGNVSCIVCEVHHSCYNRKKQGASTMTIEYTKLDGVKASGTGGGTHNILGEPERTTTNFPNSTELINIAHREWKNREARKGNHDEAAWSSGWISGYLTGRGGA